MGVMLNLRKQEITRLFREKWRIRICHRLLSLYTSSKSTQSSHLLNWRKSVKWDIKELNSSQPVSSNLQTSSTADTLTVQLITSRKPKDTWVPTSEDPCSSKRLHKTIRIRRVARWAQPDQSQRLRMLAIHMSLGISANNSLTHSVSSIERDQHRKISWLFTNQWRESTVKSCSMISLKSRTSSGNSSAIFRSLSLHQPRTGITLVMWHQIISIGRPIRLRDIESTIKAGSIKRTPSIMVKFNSFLNTGPATKQVNTT